MIQPLRRRHFRVFVVLGILLPIALVIGVVGRNSAPVMPPGSDPSKLPSLNRYGIVSERNDLFGRFNIRTRLLWDSNKRSHAVQLSSDGSISRPDLIVYWVAEGARVDGELPDNALLLGVFDSAALPLPQKLSGGVLVLYSLADQELVDVSGELKFADTPVRTGN